MSTPFDTLTDRTARDIEAAMLALRSARMFRDWPPGVLETLASEAQFRQPARRSTVTRPGTRLDSVVIVVRGAVEVGAFTRTGKKFILHTGGPGYVYGLLAVMNQPRLPQYLMVLDDTELLMVPGQAVRAALEQRPILWQAVAMELAHRYRKTMAGITDQLTAPLPQRLALSVYALVRAGSVEWRDGGAQTLRVSQADLAATLGVTRQSVNRELQALAQAGLLSLDYGRITVNDTPALRRMIEDLDSLSDGARSVARGAPID
jgi:CRP-like cAMP-binding protein